jgi:hypothetical protein
LIPARERTSVDWQSVNRLVEENRDFKDFIELVGEYHQTENTQIVVEQIIITIM